MTRPARVRWIQRAAVTAAALLLVVSPGTAGAQGQPCVLDLEARNAASPPRVLSVALPSGARETYAGGGIRYSCRGQGIVLEADSTQYNEDTQILVLVGSVQYREPRATVVADRMTYYQAEDWLIAEGRVLARLPEGSTLEGPYVEYFRATPSRPRTRTVALQRPYMLLVQQNADSAPAPPVIVVADRILSEGEDRVYLNGSVEITREDIRATSDSAYIDQTRGFSRLMRNPRVVGTGQRPYTLVGTEIDFFTADERLERVLAKGAGQVTSEDLQLDADSIDMRVVEDELERAFAWGPSRARARSSGQDVRADSIEARLPGRVLEEVLAIGNAYAETVPDSTVLRTEQRDWLRGDTIVARFDPPAPGDTAGNPVARELVATLGAQSFYQLRATGECINRPAINYVRGRVVSVELANGAVSTVSVEDEDQVAGVYLEPQPDAACLARLGEREGQRPATPLPATPPPSTPPIIPPPAPRQEP